MTVGVIEVGKVVALDGVQAKIKYTNRDKERNRFIYSGNKKGGHMAALAVSYPLTAPVVRPPVMYFWSAI